MHKFPSEISRRLKNNFLKNNPELLLYIDNPYIEELIYALFDTISENLAELHNKCISKDDLKHLRHF
jgi:hypothetical protein